MTVGKAVTVSGLQANFDSMQQKSWVHPIMVGDLAKTSYHDLFKHNHDSQYVLQPFLTTF